MSRQGFRDALDDYRKRRASGDKEHRRQTDIAASSISPQKLYGVPVGLMFFEGAQRLVTSGVTVPHMQAGDPNRIVVEAYPGVLARQFIDRRSYKNDTRKKQTQALHEARVDLFRSLHSSGFKDRYGLNIEAPGTLCDDPGGDHLDALLCAIQAAWAWQNPKMDLVRPKMSIPLKDGLPINFFPLQYIINERVHKGNEPSKSRGFLACYKGKIHAVITFLSSNLIYAVATLPSIPQYKSGNGI